ncbi:MAG TPA: hypothetical protein VMF50_10120 [Candidatus Binataceae bacterium]|nr:hypothetical protein [Candidatus Binataceae bacterium]
MNCFEARKEFGAFWRRTLEPEARAAFNRHLSVCDKCDRSFRAFALTAPVLHSECEPEPHAGISGGVRLAVRPLAAYRGPKRTVGIPAWRAVAAAAILLLVSGAAAGMAAWTAVPAPQNVMEAIAGDDPAVEPVSYTPAVSIFSQDVIGSDPSLQEPVAPAPDPNSQESEGLAG